MSTNTSYTVTEGERWDTIAYKAYGDVNRTPDIVAANPHVAITERLEAGVVLNIPVLEEPDTDTELLPPWKR